MTNLVKAFEYGGRRIRVVKHDRTDLALKFDTVDQLGVMTVAHPTAKDAEECARKYVDRQNAPRNSASVHAK